jgi:hypothetical protein
MRRALILLLCLVVASPIAAQTKKSSVPKFTLSVAFVGLGLADTMLTWHGTQHHGLVETNRLMKPFFDRGRPIDYFAVLNIQLIGSLAIVALCHMLINQDSRGAKIAGYAALIAGIVVRSYIVMHNARLNARTAHR